MKRCARGSSPTIKAGAVEAPQSKTVNPLEKGAQGLVPEDDNWAMAYRCASFKRLLLLLRVIGWKLRYAALRYGGSRVYAARSKLDLLARWCRQQNRQLEPPA